MDVSYLFKRKLIDELMVHFQSELSALMIDAGYKQLSPEDQMLAISELTHWWSLWFQKIPDPSKEISSDFQDVNLEALSLSELNEMHPHHLTWYSYLLYMTRGRQFGNT